MSCSETLSPVVPPMKTRSILPGEQVRRLLLDHREVQRAVGVERRVGGGAEPVELEGGHGKEGQARSASVARILSTSQAERQATAAKPPKIRLSGTWWSRSQPKPTSARPPQEMLAMFMRP